MNHNTRRKKEDDASVFKRKSLNAIARRKKLKKLAFTAMIIIAMVMLIAVIAAYMLD